MTAGRRLFRTQGEDGLIDRFADRWALVTGASSGIGAEFARRLAALGMHLVITARRGQLLKELADDLYTRHGTKCEVIVGDLSDPEQPGRLVAQIAAQGIEIELLVNDAGFGIAGDFEAADGDRVKQMLRLNVGAVTELTYRLLPGMLERGHGAVINVSSAAAFQPVAYMGAYSATKSYVLHFSEALWAEVRGRGVTVMALCPGITRTSFFDVAGVPAWLKKHSSQSPEQVVRAALKGLAKGRQYYVSGWGNYLLSLAVRLASRRTVVLGSTKYFRSPPKKKKSTANAPDGAAGNLE